MGPKKAKIISSEGFRLHVNLCTRFGVGLKGSQKEHGRHFAGSKSSPLFDAHERVPNRSLCSSWKMLKELPRVSQKVTTMVLLWFLLAANRVSSKERKARFGVSRHPDSSCCLFFLGGGGNVERSCVQPVLFHVRG